MIKVYDKPLNKKEVKDLIRLYGSYIKVTVDIKRKWVVFGTRLHADAELILLDKGSFQDNVWGGGINLKEKIIDTTAVLNIRPKLNNPSLEILNEKIRKSVIKIIRGFFKPLWD